MCNDQTIHATSVFPHNAVCDQLSNCNASKIRILEFQHLLIMKNRN